jgi:hypothetical protein
MPTMSSREPGLTFAVQVIMYHRPATISCLKMVLPLNSRTGADVARITCRSDLLDFNNIGAALYSHWNTGGNNHQMAFFSYAGLVR